MRRTIQSGITALAFIVAAGAANAGIISVISLADFSNPQVLDFNSAPLGNISGTDTLFTSFGIDEVSTSGVTNYSDGFDERPNSSRALWEDVNGLRIVDPEVVPATAFLGQPIAYTLKLSTAHSRFGVGVHDQAGDFTYEFFSSSVSVGSISQGAPSADLFQVYFESDMQFDEVRISVSGSGGYAIDNITLEGSGVVPAPTILSLFGIGLATLGWSRRKKG